MVIGRYEMGGEFGGKMGKDDANKKNSTTSVKRKQSPVDLNNKKKPNKRERTTLYPFTVNLMPGNDQ